MPRWSDARPMVYLAAILLADVILAVGITILAVNR